MEIKQQALEAARAYATDIDDLLVKAAKIEAYLLGTTALTRIDPAGIIGDIVDEKTHVPVSIAAEPPRPNPFNPDSLPVSLDDDAAELLALAKGLTSDLKELGYAEPDMDTYLRMNSEAIARENAKVRMKKLAEAVEKCDITDGPVSKVPDIRAEFAMENYRIERRDGGGIDYVKLRPMQLQLGDFMADESVVVNVCRQFGTTTMIAAFARQQRIRGMKVLVLTNTHRNVAVLNELIADTSVNVYSFGAVAEFAHAGEHYDHIIIDNAAFLPYALEDRVIAYVEKCKEAYIANQHATYVPGFTPWEAKVALISVPGQEQGWFYRAFTEVDSDARKLAIDWKFSAMTAEKAKELRREVGEMIFGNQFENKFRPVEQPSGTTDLTK